jgi:hypothetical protein
MSQFAANRWLRNHHQPPRHLLKNGVNRGIGS